MRGSDVRARRASRQTLNHDRVFVHEFSVQKWVKTGWHCHSDVELTYVTQGSGTRYVGESISRFEPGDLCLVGREVPHVWVWDEGEPTIGAVFMQFSYGLVADAVHGAFGERLRLLLDRSEHGLRIVSGGDNVLEEMRRAANPAATPHEVLARTIAVLSMLEPEGIAVPLSDGRASGSNAGQPAAIRKILRAVHESFTEELSQRKMAKLLKLSPAAFSRFFKQHVGRAFRPYIIELRVAHACRLLRDSDLSVSEIAFASGFSNLANFNRQFRRVREETPRAYRERAKQVW